MPITDTSHCLFVLHRDEFFLRINALRKKKNIRSVFSRSPGRLDLGYSNDCDLKHLARYSCPSEAIINIAADLEDEELVVSVDGKDHVFMENNRVYIYAVFTQR